MAYRVEIRSIETDKVIYGGDHIRPGTKFHTWDSKGQVNDLCRFMNLYLDYNYAVILDSDGSEIERIEPAEKPWFM